MGNETGKTRNSPPKCTFGNRCRQGALNLPSLEPSLQTKTHAYQSDDEFDGQL